MRWNPRLGTVLLIINLGILLLPLGGIGALRLYESELIRRTESELISQGSVIGAVYREELLRQLPSAAYGTSKNTSITYGVPISFQQSTQSDSSQKYHPITPKLDISGENVRPPAPAAIAPSMSVDPFASQAGKQIAPILQSSKDTTLIGVRVLDGNGTVVATTGSELGLSLHNREEAQRALTGEYVSLLRQRISDESQPNATSLSRGNLMRVFVGIPVINDGRVLGAVVLSRTPLDIRKALFLVRDQIAVAAALLLGVVLIVTVLTSIMVNRPLKSLVGQSERIVHGEKVVMQGLDKSGIHEIVQLSHAMSTMAKTLEERADYIRTFAANVSHEFKTPLTSIRGTVELLDDHFPDMSAEERSRFLHMISFDTERLERLVRRLLDLARADTIAVGEERTEALEAVKSLAVRYCEQGVSVSVESGSSGFYLKMAREAFESIVSNIIDNARQHGGDCVQIHICGRVASRAGVSGVELDFQDNGPGISEGNRGKIFQPFFTTARETGGSGLGLSIVQSLLHSHGGTITLEPNNNGALFRIWLPVC